MLLSLPMANMAKVVDFMHAALMASCADLELEFIGSQLCFLLSQLLLMMSQLLCFVFKLLSLQVGLCFGFLLSLQIHEPQSDFTALLWSAVCSSKGL